MNIMEEKSKEDLEAHLNNEQIQDGEDKLSDTVDKKQPTRTFFLPFFNISKDGEKINLKKK